MPDEVGRVTFGPGFRRKGRGPECYGHCPDEPHYHAADFGRAGANIVEGAWARERHELKPLLQEVVLVLEPYAGLGKLGRRVNALLAKVKDQLERWP